MTIQDVKEVLVKEGFQKFSEDVFETYEVFLSRMNGEIGSWYHPAVLLMWEGYSYYKIIEDFFCIIYVEEEDGKTVVSTFAPCGDYEVASFPVVVDELNEIFSILQMPLWFIYVHDWMKPYMNHLSEYERKEQYCPDCSDYILRMEDLKNIMAKGKHQYYSRRFYRVYQPLIRQYQVEDENPCLRLLEESWCQRHQCEECQCGCLKKAFSTVLPMIDSLHFKMYVIFSQDKLIAYMGFAETEKELIFFAKKMRRELRGFTDFMLDFILETWGDRYEFVNYTEDMGIEGLRKHKQLLAPYELRHVYEIIMTHR